MESIVAVIPAAGQGRRMGSDLNKQYLSLADKPIVAHTIEKFQEFEQIKDIIVIAREDEIAYCQHEVIDKYKFDKVSQVIKGGQTRQESVYNGLQAVDSAEYVLIHDGARPLLTKELLECTIRELKDYGAVGVAVPVKDTIKMIDNEKFVDKTPDRSKLWAIQTPQAFSYNLILEAYEEAKNEGFVGTDSSMLVERLGKKVKLIHGSYENLKVTTPEDLMIAETIIKGRR
ncbi:2-C-methyl-D-erythritol 4-phosphate cytidylyltransferase [Selenihalanaerobacter shriftii]|uniref:2-C-methyl-D-erythritol 4-phosphate cytidylyltransferase n=1 Tax=Selenihalanaerobacter shriftii TaxID=142842 RepID=A0A1T4QE27_9FIRM|nr:2-C-methyl-D-erythritol 4-phosphate cytidylyltransferase [Selenihalanaerobacter shriftii]SKA01488.1 2-C-methyl-D-erythritol 4-phosphate cytidylyltransferase [Selenihalanaerobacter shriftii]